MNSQEGQRANTDHEKHEIIERLHRLWIANPELRLGQLILNAFRRGEDFYYMEDRALVEHIEELYQKQHEITGRD